VGEASTAAVVDMDVFGQLLEIVSDSLSLGGDFEGRSRQAAPALNVIRRSRRREAVLLGSVWAGEGTPSCSTSAGAPPLRETQHVKGDRFSDQPC
jgi:hypothetical protein